MQARWGTHGDRGVIALSPGSVRECFDVTIKAVNFSEKFRMPVILLLDEVIGHMRERVELPEQTEFEIINRKFPIVPPQEYQAYKPDEDGVPPMAPFGEGYFYHVTGLIHNYNGMPSQSAEMTDEIIRRLHTKIDNAKDEITLYTEDYMEDAEVVVVAYGGSSRGGDCSSKRGPPPGGLKPVY